jgi:hypothetical protein
MASLNIRCQSCDTWNKFPLTKTNRKCKSCKQAV